MKIKTITCHDVYNLGASLQAYALAAYLRQLGHETEIIHYKPRYLSGHYGLWGVSNPKFDKPLIRTAYSLVKFPRRLAKRMGKRKKEFDLFRKKYLPCTRTRYESFEQLKQHPPKADVYFAGSDQIWNTVFSNGRDPSFYLQFAPKETVRASYAASFATETVLPEYRNQVQQWLGEMDNISVRESSGLTILEDLGIDGGVQVMDPVFLLNREHWEKICQPIELKRPYLLIYDFDKSPQIEAFVKKISQEKHLLIYSMLPCSYCNRSFENSGPKTFLSLVKDAEVVVSNSFHATAFSIIFERNFWAFPRQEKINTRMRDLTALMNLGHRYVETLDLNLTEEIDYREVKEILELQTQSSKKFILDTVRSAEQS